MILENLEKIFFLLIKMTVTDQLKIIDNKIKANQTQHDLHRLGAKISAYSSSDLGILLVKIWIQTNGSRTR